MVKPALSFRMRKPSVRVNWAAMIAARRTPEPAGQPQTQPSTKTGAGEQDFLPGLEYLRSRARKHKAKSRRSLND